MWTAHRAALAERTGELLTLASGDRALSTGDVIALWRADDAFRDFFIAALAASSYEAFFWEMPPLDRDTLSHVFECAIIRNGVLARMRADDADFTEHLRGPEPVAAFLNLGGDALLITPRKIADVESYGHIAAFVRHAPREQQHALLRRVALEVEKRLSNSRERFWISTSGLGVPWVHVRLDRSPKYYQYKRYAN